MNKYVVFGKHGEVIVYASSWIRSIQIAMQLGGVADHWNSHLVSEYNRKWQDRFDAKLPVLRESEMQGM